MIYALILSILAALNPTGGDQWDPDELERVADVQVMDVRPNRFDPDSLPPHQRGDAAPAPISR